MIQKIKPIKCLEISVCRGSVLRLLLAAVFAVTGAIMQGVTKNSLADSGLLGINSGAAVGLAVAFILFPSLQPNQAALFSFLGAFLATSFLFCLTKYSRIGMTPTGLILAGVALSSFFSAISQVLSLQFDLNQDLAFWFIGRCSKCNVDTITSDHPIYLVALFIILGLGKSLNLLAMGDETAISLGKTS